MKRKYSGKKNPPPSETESDLLLFLQSSLGTFSSELLNGAYIFPPFSANTGNPYRGGNKWMLFKASVGVISRISAPGAPVSTNPYATAYPFLSGFITFKQARAANMPIIKGSKAVGAIRIFHEELRVDQGDDRNQYQLNKVHVPVFWIGDCRMDLADDISPEEAQTRARILGILENKRQELFTKLAALTAEVYVPKGDSLVCLCLKSLIQSKQEGKIDAVMSKKIHTTLKLLQGDTSPHGFQVGLMWPLSLYDPAEKWIADWNTSQLVPTAVLLRYAKNASNYINGMHYYTHVMTVAAMYIFLFTPNMRTNNDHPVLKHVKKHFGKRLKCRDSNCCNKSSKKSCLQLRMLAALFFAMERCHQLDIAISDLYYFQTLAQKIRHAICTTDIQAATSTYTIKQWEYADYYTSLVIQNIIGKTVTYEFAPLSAMTSKRIEEVYYKVQQLIKEHFLLT